MAPWKSWIKDQRIKDHQVKDHRIKDQRIKDHQVKDHRIKDHRIKDHWINDQFKMKKRQFLSIDKSIDKNEVACTKISDFTPWSKNSCVLL